MPDEVAVTERATTPPPRSRSGRTVAVGVALVVLILAGVAAAVTLGRDDPTAPTDPSLANAPDGLPAPSLQERPDPNQQSPLPDRVLDGFAEGPPVDVTDYRGEPLVINFWASWCAPCVREMPDFQQVASEAGDDVAFLGVDVRDAALNAEPFVQQLGVTYDLAVDLDGSYWREVGGFGMPTTLFVQPDGTVVFRHTGPLDAAELRSLVHEHLGVTI